MDGNSEVKYDTSVPFEQIIPQTSSANQTVIRFDSTVFSTDLYSKDSKDPFVAELRRFRSSVLKSVSREESKLSKRQSTDLNDNNLALPSLETQIQAVSSELIRGGSYRFNKRNTSESEQKITLQDLRQPMIDKGIESEADQNFILLSMHQFYGSVFFIASNRIAGFFNLLFRRDLASEPSSKIFLEDYFTYLESFDKETRTVRLRQQYVHDGKVVANADVVLNLDTRSIRYETVFMVVDKSYVEVEQACANVPEGFLHKDSANSAITFVTQDVLAARAWIAEQEQQREQEYKELAQAARGVLDEIPTWFTNLETFNQRRLRFEQALEQVRSRHCMDIKVPTIFSRLLNAPDPYAPKPSTSFPWGRFFKWLLWSLVVLFSMMMVFGTVVGALFGKDLGFLDILGEGNNVNIIIFGAIGTGFLLLAKIFGSATWQDFRKSNWSIALPIIGLVVGGLLIVAVPVLPAANLVNLSDPAIFYLVGSALAFVAFSLLFGIKRYLIPTVASTTFASPPTPQVNYSTPTVASLPSASITLNRFEVSLNALLASCKLTLDETALKKVKEIFHGLSSDAKAAPTGSDSIRNQLPNDPNSQNVAEALQIYIDREQPRNNIDPAVNGCLQKILGAYIQSQPQPVLPHSTSSLSALHSS